MGLPAKPKAEMPAPVKRRRVRPPLKALGLEGYTELDPSGAPVEVPEHLRASTQAYLERILIPRLERREARAARVKSREKSYRKKHGIKGTVTGEDIFTKGSKRKREKLAERSNLRKAWSALNSIGPNLAAQRAGFPSAEAARATLERLKNGGTAEPGEELVEAKARHPRSPLDPIINEVDRMSPEERRRAVDIPARFASQARVNLAQKTLPAIERAEKRHAAAKAEFEAYERTHNVKPGTFKVPGQGSPRATRRVERKLRRLHSRVDLRSVRVDHAAQWRGYASPEAARATFAKLAGGAK